MSILTFVLGFLIPSFQLYGQIFERGPEWRSRIGRILEHMCVMAIFVALTAIVEFFLGWGLPFGVIEVPSVVWLSGSLFGWTFNGSHWVFTHALIPLSKEFPFLVNFAEEAHKSPLSDSLRKLLRRVLQAFRAEYDTAFREIDVGQ
jgi:hypothetical protein